VPRRGVRLNSWKRLRASAQIDLAVRLGSPFSVSAKDSLWSIDLFRCESRSLRTHWVLLVMDQFTRRIIGFGIHRGTVGDAHSPSPIRTNSNSPWAWNVWTATVLPIQALPRPFRQFENACCVMRKWGRRSRRSRN